MTDPAGAAHSSRRFLVLSILLLFLYLLLGFIKNWDSTIPAFLTIYFVCFAVYGICMYWLFRGEFARTRNLAILLPALLFRLALIFTEPSLSEDFYRYRWDGVVQKAGVGPYDYPPNAIELGHLRDQYFERINHKQFRTPYPAAAETFFHLFARVTTDIRLFKFFILLFEFSLLEVLRRLLRKENEDSGWLLVYAWHPLPIIEFAGSGHMDVIGIFSLLFGYLLLQNHRAALSGVAFSVAVFTKYLPAATFPWFLRTGKWRFLISGACIGLLLMAQYLTWDLQMFSGVLTYYRKWRFNDSLFGILYEALGGAEPARITGMLITIGVTAFCFLKKFSIYRAAFWIFGTVMLFSPVLHPWYLCWILPFLVFHRNKAWIFFCGWIALAYVIRYLFPGGLWKPVLWLKLLIYLPFYLWLVIDLLLSRRRSLLGV